MDVFQIQAGSLGDAVLMHQAGHIWRHHVFGPVTNMVVCFFNAHARRDRFVRYAEGSSETATIIRTIDGNDDDTSYFGKQIGRLVKGDSHDLRPFLDTEAPTATAAILAC